MRNRIRSLFFLFLALLPQEAFVSGTQYMEGVSGFVYVMVAVGLKIPGRTSEMQSAANAANIERMEQGSKQALIIAQKLEARLTNLIQSFKDQDVGFVPIEKNYEIITKESSNYAKMPTYSDKDPWQRGSNPYYLAYQGPLVVVRFNRWPGPKIRAAIKKAVHEVLTEFSLQGDFREIE